MADSPTIQNRKARFEYEILEELVVGIQLTGTEIKSVRKGKVSLDQAYCLFDHNELYVRGMNIAEYEMGSHYNHEPVRDRKLLLKRREIKKWQNKLKDVGLTMVPLRMFIHSNGWAKMNIALVKGKKSHDKRDSIKERDVKRDLDRLYKR
jgi:SsrA-binding protein